MSDAWQKSFVLSISLLALLVLYVLGYSGRLSIAGLLSSIAATGGFLLGISFLLSSAVHSRSWRRRYIRYRKQIGISGYLHALVYTVLLIAGEPEIYFGDFPEHLITLPSLLGIVAMTLLTMMFLASNRKVTQGLGHSRWKTIMRLGYFAYAMLVVRAGIMEWEIWTGWLSQPDGLPPPRLLLSVFASAVILERLRLAVSTTRTDAGT